MTALSQRLLDVFQVEYREHLEAIRRILSKPGGSGAGAPELNEATRRAHSLKGAARAVGIQPVETLAHALESLFLKVQGGEAALDRDTRKHIYDTLDEIEDRVAAPFGAAPSDPEPRAAPTVKQPAAAPPPAASEPQQREPEASEAPAAERPAAPQSDLVRVDAEDLDSLLKSAGELHSDMLFQNVGAQEVRSLSLKMMALENRWLQAWKQVERSIRESAVVSNRSLAGGEEIASQIKVLSKDLRSVAQRQAQGAKSLRHHLNELERRVMAARMMPAESVFGGFRKMVRDLAASEGKPVDVSIDGLDCEADRLVLQRIKDPVMHILRNAISHGIETPEEREQRGKDSRGEVRLSIAAEHDRLRIVIEDDGRGVDFGRIAEKAVEEGRLTREEARSASEKMLGHFLFEPGFSTAERLTTISGRGVGLSIAQETVADLQGTIEVSARPGGGTRIEVALPVSILARRLLLVSLKDQVFALPCESVAKVMRVALSDITTLEGRPVIRLKDITLPLTSIGELLSLGDTIFTAGRPKVSVAVVRKGEAQIGVAVESFVGVNDFVVRHFETGSRKRRSWMGLITTEEGAPCLVLNTDALLGSETAKHSKGVVFETEKKDADRSKVILVVDDSITTRTLEKSILEAHGYRVRLSVDGRDALAQLRSELPDVVVSDIEMPHVNGFELLRAMKEDKRLSDVPVILVTSRSDAKDREKGLTLGADAYVVKQRFDQNDLLQTIRQIV